MDREVLRALLKEIVRFHSHQPCWVVHTEAFERAAEAAGVTVDLGRNTVEPAKVTARGFV
jgi:hypothetical protein